MSEQTPTQGAPENRPFVDYLPLDTKIGHFGDVLPSQSFGTVLKKLNLTKLKQTTQKQNSLS